MPARRFLAFWGLPERFQREGSVTNSDRLPGIWSQCGSWEFSVEGEASGGKIRTTSSSLLARPVAFLRTETVGRAKSKGPE